MQQLQPKQTGLVYFDSDPRNAKIYVDGQVLTDPDTEESLRTPAKALLIEGRRDFTLSLDGYEDESGYVDVLAGVSVNIYRRLKQGKSGEGWGQPQQQWFIGQEQPGIIKVYSYPDGADIFVDGRPAGKAPTVINNVPGGAHRITFKMPGMMVEEKTVDVHPGAWSSIDATMRPILPSLSNYQLSNYQLSDQSYESPYIEYTKVVETLQPSKDISGDVVITTYPAGATITMDGKLVIDTETKEPLTTPVDLVMYIGTHDLVFNLPGYCDEFATLYVSPGYTSYIHNNFNIC